MTVYLDCDGTWIDLYGVDNWLEYLINEDVYPYKMAKPLVNLSTLARTIHRLQENNIKVGIISWLSKNGSEDYNRTKISKTTYKKAVQKAAFSKNVSKHLNNSSNRDKYLK